MENQNPKQKKKIITKAVCIVISILLMIGIAFIVANYVHKNNALPASAEVKNGLSAYELAVEQGYNGSVDEWLKTLDGKSAYEIAVDNGYSGTEDEWNKAIANVSQNNATIKNAEFSKDGDLIITLSDGTTINVGKVAGSDGKNGTNGKNGSDGKNGIDGKNGVDGKDGINGTNGIDGKDGQDGKGVSSACVNSDGQLILTFSDGSTVNLDKVVGTNGADGVSVTNSVINDKGELVLTYSNGQVYNLGNVIGADGKNGIDGKDGINGTDGKDGVNGIDGKDGQDGISVIKSEINANGELVVTYSNNVIDNLGVVVGADGKDGRGISKTELVNGELIITYTDGTSDNLGSINSEYTNEALVFIEQADGTLSVQINNSYAASVESLKIPSTYNGKVVTQINEHAFESCVNLKEIDIPNTIKYIGTYAFYKCPLINIDLKNTEYIGESAFAYCKKLVSATLNKVITIDNSAFLYCSNLASVSFDSVERIEANAFNRCISLNVVFFPKTLTYIGSYAFYSTNGLQHANFEDPYNWYRYGTDSCNFEDAASAAKSLNTSASFEKRT